ncbi:MAG: hypothetical protein KGM15_02945 [Pseudomonadota bacterium]|nr:hypothetical protein [Pseudomonadota bacterium]
MNDAAASDSEMSGDAAARAGLPANVEPTRREADEAATLKLLPFHPSREDNPFFAERGEDAFFAARPDSPAPTRAPRDWRRLGAAASLAAVVAIGAAAAAAHIHGLQVTRTGQTETQALTQKVDAMTARLQSLEANRANDELASLKKLLSEIKAGAASTRDVGGAVGQLAARMDRLEKEQGARLDKLGDRIDQNAAARLAGVTARLDKLEAKATVAAVAPAVKATGKTDAARFPAGVSNETTGAIDRPRAVLRGLRLAEIHNGYAMIDSPEGEFAVAPGDFVPGGGRVLRIERHGRDWVVVTTRGQIAAVD